MMKSMMKRLIAGVLLTGAVACGGSEATGGGAPPESLDPLEVVSAKAGTYEGSWEMFGRDASGAIYSAMTWTDIAVADRPTLEEGRAYVHVTDSMETSMGMSLEQEWIEGVLIEPDGSVGPQFIEMDGVVTELDEIAPDHFQYQVALSSSDFYFLEGITQASLIEGHHLVDKVVSSEGGQETHQIHRTTHIAWTDDAGETMTADFESLTGTHHKTK